MNAAVPEYKLINNRPLVFLFVVILLAEEPVTIEKSRIYSC